MTMRFLGLVLGASLSASAANAVETFDCVIEPNRIVQLASPVIGILTEVNVGRGDEVLAGQTVARIEDRLERANVELQEMRVSMDAQIRAQQARLALSQERMERVRQLLDRGAATRDAFDEATAELDVNLAELERLEMEQRLTGQELILAKAALALRQIQSSLDGIVVERVLSPGEYVSQDAHILKIADIDPLNIEVYLPVGYFPQIALGDVGTVKTLQPRGGAFEATVTVVDRLFDAASNTFGLRLSLDNPDRKIPAGQRCTVSLDLEALDLPGQGLLPLPQ